MNQLHVKVMVADPKPDKPWAQLECFPTTEYTRERTEVHVNFLSVVGYREASKEEYREYLDNPTLEDLPPVWLNEEIDRRIRALQYRFNRTDQLLQRPWEL